MSVRHVLRALREPRSANELLLARLTVLVVLTVILNSRTPSCSIGSKRNAPGSEVTAGDALFWTSSQITTISSSLANPISTGGRILAVLTDLVSIAMVSLLFGTIAQHPHREPHARAVVPPNGREDDCRAVNHRRCA